MRNKHWRLDCGEQAPRHPCLLHDGHIARQCVEHDNVHVMRVGAKIVALEETLASEKWVVAAEVPSLLLLF